MTETFILLCRDKEHSFGLRTKTRPAHLEYIRQASAQVLLAGPILNAENVPIGSMLIITADDEEGATHFAANDPYARAGLFENVEVQTYRIGAGLLAKTLD